MVGPSLSLAGLDLVLLIGKHALQDPADCQVVVYHQDASNSHLDSGELEQIFPSSGGLELFLEQPPLFEILWSFRQDITIMEIILRY